MNLLICMRLENMLRRHAEQDNSRVCSRCREPVGIYPSGQRALKADSKMAIVCDVCASKAPMHPGDITAPAPGAIQEAIDSLAREKKERRH